jgi:diguanylate cyclase (GGDEF)-like protein
LLLWIAVMSTPSAPPLVAPRCSLLVVDDEPYIVETLAGLLAKDFDVKTALSADEAQSICAEQPIALILADQKMPERTGVELLEWVRQNSPKTVRMMMTGFADFEETVRAINRGQVYRIILKPWRTDELSLILKNAARAYTLERSHEQLLGDLQKLNAELEDRVQMRTRELEEAVHQLRQRNLMLERLSLTDALTGLPNRRAMDRVIEAEVRRRARHPSPLAVGVIDADNFKQINTSYLLPGGDQALISLGQVLAASVRVEDTVGRIGGEEFLVVAPETTLEGARVLAERMRSRVEGASVFYKTALIRLTVSIGFAVAPAGAPATAAQLKELAAGALKQAKDQGRNRCVITAAS